MKATVHIPTALRGRYKIEAVGLFGNRRLLADWFDNLITNTGLDSLAVTGDQFGTCCVGSGNTAPANTNTALASLVASTVTIQSSNNSNSGSSPYFGTMTRVYRFAIGVATGNLSEVGVGNTSTTLFSRALILDGVGSPTTITVLSTEALDVTYQVQYYAPLADVTGTITINAVSYAYVMRAALASSGSWSGRQASTFGPSYDQVGLSQVVAYNGSIGTITGQPTGASASVDNSTANMSYPAYVNGNLYQDTIVSWGLTDGNVAGGISAMRLNYGRQHGTMGVFQMSFTPVLPKDASHTMTLTFRQSWNRH